MLTEVLGTLYEAFPMPVALGKNDTKQLWPGERTHSCRPPLGWNWGGIQAVGPFEEPDSFCLPEIYEPPAPKREEVDWGNLRLEVEAVLEKPLSDEEFKVLYQTGLRPLTLREEEQLQAYHAAEEDYHRNQDKQRPIIKENSVFVGKPLDF